MRAEDGLEEMARQVPDLHAVDVVLDPSRTSPGFGALFAVNMLVATEGGNTYSFEEYREDLESAAFAEIQLQRTDPLMNAVIGARKRE